MIIRFEGALTGEAAKHYLKRSYYFDRILYCASCVMISPLIVLLSIKLNYLRIIPAYIFVNITLIIITFLPIANKEYMKKVPRCIVIEDGYVTCSGEKYEETRPLDCVKMVKDYGEFYELVFILGKISPKYQCQKKLLDMGTIEDFEELFEGKLIRM